MYSFISTKHYPLVRKYSTVDNTDFPYTWQYLKTTEDGDFSRDNSLIYLKGMDPNSQVLSPLSTIKWDYLNNFCGGNNGVKWCNDIIDFKGENYGFMTVNLKFILNLNQKAIIFLKTHCLHHVMFITG